MIIEKIKKYNLILGSNSPRRKKIIEEMGFKVNIIPANIDETIKKEIKLEKIPVFLANEKSKALKNLIKQNDILITADTIVIFENKILNKPKNKADAIKNLYKHFDDLDIHNYNIANYAVNKSKKVLIVKNTNLFEFERLINYSKLAISCHSGFMVQVCGANKSEVLDILNEKDGKWIDHWIPLNTSYKRIFKSLNNKSLNFDEIIKQIN